MKTISTSLLIVLTVMLVVTTLLALYGAAPMLLAGLQFVAFLLLPLAVYRVLLEPHPTSLRFKDWYADAPRHRDG